jgi:ABC-type sugar transport system ATPase subunit
MTEPILRMTGIVKQFPGVRALDGVDLDVLPGEVHCLLGQNGAGKSTLIKVLSGAHRPDEGTITWLGEEVRLAHPTAAMRRGIATIYQELDLVDGLSVAANIFLGHELASVGFARRWEMRRAARDLLARLDRMYDAPLPYIAAWHQAPVREGRDLAYTHLQLFSMQRSANRWKYLAGSESGMGAFVNDVRPEDLAERLRDLA